MQGPRVKVIIDKKGNAEVEMIDFHGVGCQELADKLRQIGRVTSETTRPEFYESNGNQNTLESNL